MFRKSECSSLLGRYFGSLREVRDFYVANAGSALMCAVRDVFFDSYEGGVKVAGGLRHYFYREYWVSGEAVFFWVRDWQDATAGLTCNGEVVASLYEWIDASLVRRIRARAGGVSTPTRLFLRIFEGRYGGRFSREDVLRFFVCFVAWEFRGAFFERVAYGNLRKVFGGDSVRWASKVEEKNDVDVWVCGVPVSVKCGDAFSERTFREYGRKVAGYSLKPVLYVNEKLEWVVRDGSGFRWGSAAGLSAVVGELAGGSSVLLAA